MTLISTEETIRRLRGTGADVRIADGRVVARLTDGGRVFEVELGRNDEFAIREVMRQIREWQADHPTAPSAGVEQAGQRSA